MPSRVAGMGGVLKRTDIPVCQHVPGRMFQSCLWALQELWLLPLWLVLPLSVPRRCLSTGYEDSAHAHRWKMPLLLYWFLLWVYWVRYSRLHSPCFSCLFLMASEHLKSCMCLIRNFCHHCPVWEKQACLQCRGPVWALYALSSLCAL